MKNCFQWSIFRLGPVTAAFEGREYVIYHYSRYLETHMNDFSVRFRTKQSNAILFQTYSTQGHNDFIRAELENGRIKVTVRVNGRDQVKSSRIFIYKKKWTCINSACFSFQDGNFHSPCISPVLHYINTLSTVCRVCVYHYIFMTSSKRKWTVLLFFFLEILFFILTLLKKYINYKLHYPLEGKSFL